MILQKQPTRWSCLPTAFAMVLRIDVNWLIKKIGHDGSEIIDTRLEDPFSRRGFHIQELIDIAYKLNYLVMPIEACPCVLFQELYDQEKQNERLVKYLSDNDGILTGECLGSEKGHAVAWTNGQVIDPTDKEIKDLSCLKIKTFWMVNRKYDKIKQRSSI